ncbi:hypothetical protein Ade02nite_59130 [Paractinoplanes deccanensis]|uniref:Uncharacterized protein n=1 Tax=Paractinoplanes deccanensis TaxID=113561 RepID=A0ABQ3YB67_9ACTN|nr:hypothetical protein [Actinoplanes deccanensis]GID77272.1 hypothetical protein Ade02nite_59130 [Actinoplanes deccanensis]
MGLHCGYIAATAEPAQLLAQLSRHAGALVPGAQVESADDAVLGRFDLLLGGGDGRAFAVDTSMLLSDSPDMIVALSAELGTVVAFDATRFPASGAIGAIRREHYEKHKRPDDAWLSEMTAAEARPSRRP